MVTTRRIFLVSGLACATLAFHAPRASIAAAPSARAGSSVITRDTVLANGFTIIVAENHAVPIATAEVVVRTGAFTQRPGEEGISHLYEHLLFRAYGGDQRFAVEVAALDGFYNGETSEDHVDYYITAPARRMPTTVQMLARLVISPSFRDGDIEAERKIVRSEFEGDASDAAFVLRTEMGKHLWGDDWFRRDALGTAASIRVPDARLLREVYERFYVPNNAALVVSGDVRAGDVIAEAVRRFGGWKGAADPFAQSPIPSAPPLAASRTFATAAPHQRLVSVSIAWPGPSVRDDPTAARVAESFAYVVSSRVSPLVDRLVNTGLVQSAALSYTPRARGGPITLTVVMLPAAVERALPALRSEIDRFGSSDYLGEALLFAARKEQAVDAAFALERGSSVAHELGARWAVGGFTYARTPVDPGEETTVAELERLVRGAVVGHPYVAGALTAPADVDRVRRLLEQTFGPGAAR